MPHSNIPQPVPTACVIHSGWWAYRLHIWAAPRQRGCLCTMPFIRAITKSRNKSYNNHSVDFLKFQFNQDRAVCARPFNCNSFVMPNGDAPHPLLSFVIHRMDSFREYHLDDTDTLLVHIIIIAVDTSRGYSLDVVMGDGWIRGWRWRARGWRQRVRRWWWRWLTIHAHMFHNFAARFGVFRQVVEHSASTRHTVVRLLFVRRTVVVCVPH